MSLTKRSIDAAVYEGDGKSWDLRSDGTIPDFYLRVYPSGYKSYVLRYRFGGKRRHLTVGAARELTLAQARKLAAQNRIKIRAGVDPQAERRAAQEASGDNSGNSTFAALALKYLRHHSKPDRESWRDAARRLGYRWDDAEQSFVLDEVKREGRRSTGQVVLRIIGQRRLEEIKVDDILEIREEIAKRGKYEANRVCGQIRAVINKAVEWGDLPRDFDNPAARVKHLNEPSRVRWVRPEELPRLARAIQDESNVYVRAVLWLYLFSGVRRREALTAKWDYVDLESGTLTLPKTKNRRPRVVLLAPQAIVLLRSLPRLEGNFYVFPGRRDGRPLVNIDKPWRRIRSSAGLEDLRIHDLRRTFGSLLASRGVSLKMIAEMMGHTDIRATEIYAQLYNAALQTTLEDHGKSLLDLCGVNLTEITTHDLDESRRADI